MDWLADRLVEPSTWRGVGLALVALGLVPAGSVDLIVSAGVGLVGLVEMARKEKR